MTYAAPSLDPIYNSAIAYKQGGAITVASNTTLSIAPVLVRDTKNAQDINVGDYFGTQTSTTVNTGVVGLNGLDTGVLLASKVYAVYAVMDQAGYNPSGFILSLNQSTPLMPSGAFPSGYSSYARIGYAVTDSSVHFLAMKQSGLGSVVTYSFDAPVKILNAGTSGTQAAVDLSSVVPAVDGVPVILGCDFVSDTAGKKATLCYSGGTIASSRNILNAQVAAVHVIQDYTIPAALISGVPKVDYIISAATSTLDLYVNGFVDNLL